MTALPRTAFEAGLEQVRAALHDTVDSPRHLAREALPPEFKGALSDDMEARLRASAVLVPLIAREEGIQLLLTQRVDTLRNHHGQITFPGGARDVDDASFAATALREAREEIGVPPAFVEVIGYLDDFPVFSGFRITPVVGIILRDFTPVLSQGEVSSLLTLPLKRVLEDGAFEKKTFTRDGVELSTYQITHDKHIIWGATAGILWELRTRLISVQPAAE